MNSKRVLEELSQDFGFFYRITKELHREKTPYQELRIVETPEFGRVMLLDGFTQVGERKHFQYHELIADAPLLAHPNPENILVIGGGDGGVDHHILQHPSIKSIDHIELDEIVTQRSLEFLPSVSAGALSSSRVHLQFRDGKQFVHETTSQYDVIIMDLTDPVGPAADLYTQGFLHKLKTLFKNEHSVLSLHTTSPIIELRLFATIIKTLNSVFGEVITFYNYIQMYGTLWSVSIVGNKGLQPEKTTLQKRILERKLTSLKLLNADSYFSLQTAFPYIQEIFKQEVPIAKHQDDLYSASPL